MIKRILAQSARNASMGRILVAFLAGNSPASVPATIRVTVAWMAMPISTVGSLN